MDEGFDGDIKINDPDAKYFEDWQTVSECNTSDTWQRNALKDKYSFFHIDSKNKYSMHCGASSTVHQNEQLFSPKFSFGKGKGALFFWVLYSSSKSENYGFYLWIESEDEWNQIWTLPDDGTNSYHWKKFHVDLSEYRFKPSLRLCWMYYGQNGTDIALDGVKIIPPAVDPENVSEGPKVCSDFIKNYPNPFNTSTTIEFAIPHKTHVSLFIYNTLGQQVTQLIDSELDKGRYNRTWCADGQPTGVYFVRLLTNEQTKIQKILYVK